MHTVTRALVLRETGYKETDKILTLLTQDQGKRTVKARGCRRPNSPLAAGAQLLVFSDMTLFDYRDRWELKESATVEEFRGLRGDLAKLALGTYFAEAVEAVAEEGVTVPGLLSLILNSLYALERLDRPAGLIKGAFEWKLASLIGYAPLADGCAVCGRADPEEPRINLSEGAVHCAACRRELADDGISMPLDGASLAALRHVVYGEPKRLFSFRLPPESLALFRGAAESFFLTQVERSFHTLEYYKSLTEAAVW